jgi:exodeoxyribonuclease-5
MADMVLTDKQAAGLRAAKEWFLHRTHQQQVFRIFGYAGVGKSTIIRYLVDELGLTDGRDVLYCTFAGKASHVLRKKGIPSQTIHSLIYLPLGEKETEIDNTQKQIEELRAAALTADNIERAALGVEIAKLSRKLNKLLDPDWSLNEESAIRDCKLVIPDECSMVGPKMAADLLSFEKPVLVLGDPGQLPPIEGEGAFTKCEPDVLLTEIHRQAAESAIIRLATMARLGESIPYGKHDEFVWKMAERDVTAAQLLKGGQVICGKHATRFDLNNAMRRAAGFNGSATPTGPGEKIIYRKNDNALGLLNGMFITLDDVEIVDDQRFRAVVRNEEASIIGGTNSKGKPNKLTLYSGLFHDHEKFDKERKARDWKIRRRLVEADFGWAITGHVSQGSQWENVIVFDDRWGFNKQDRRRWLYTAITRAESGLVILD